MRNHGNEDYELGNGFSRHKTYKVNCDLPGKLIATFSPRRCRILLVNVLKRGCPGKMPSSGKNNDLVTPSWGVGE